MALIDSFDGFETGDTSAWATLTVGDAVIDSPNARPSASSGMPAGAYALRTDFVNPSEYYMRTLQAATTYSRFGFMTSAGPNGIASVFATHGMTNTSAAAIWSVRQVANSSNQLFLRLWNEISGAQVGSDVAVNASTYYLLEVKTVISASAGVLELRINGSVVATGSSLNTGTANCAAFVINGSLKSGTAPSGYYWTDDVAIGSSAYIGDGYCIARQGKTGTPTYDAWTKTGLSTSALNWSQTPYNATDNCNSATSSAAETMLVASFATGSGLTGVIGVNDTINAAKVAMICKCSSGSALMIRRRVGGTNTDFTPQGNPATTDSYSDTTGALIAPLGTASLYYSPNTAPFTDTLANLDAYEIGAVKQANTNTDTVEDMWLMADFTPAAVSPLGTKLITRVGAAQLINASFVTIPGSVTWYLGLITLPTGLFETTDTMASHNWSEFTGYSNATRPQFVPGALGAIGDIQELDNGNSPAWFTITASAVLFGAFVVSTSDIGGSDGLLYSVVAFAEPKPVRSGDTFGVTQTLLVTAG